MSRGFHTALIRRGPWGVIQQHDVEATSLPTFRIDSLSELAGHVERFNRTAR